MRKILIAGAVILFVVIAVALKNGWVHTNTSAAQLPQEIVERLVALRSHLAEEATKSEQMSSDSDRFDGQLNQLGSAAADSKNTFVPIVVRGLRIQNGLTHSLILFNTSAYLQLELIADGIVARDGYTELDERLLKLENSFGDQDNVCSRLMQQEKLLSQAMESAKNESETNGEREIVSLLDAGVIDSSITTDQTIAAYREKIKPGTEVLRGIVDKIAKMGTGGSAP
jgi:hypothetical protein